MIVKCVHYSEVQDKYDNKVFYQPNGEYEVTAERGTELIRSGYFVALEGVTEEQVQAVASAIIDEAKEQEKTIDEIVDEVIEEKPKKAVKKSTK